MNVIIEQAALHQTAEVSEVLQEAANWLIEKGEKLWEPSELAPEKIKSQVESGIFWLAKIEGETVGCLRFQTEDKEYWDDVPHFDSAFVHRVAVKRSYAGKGVAAAMLDWAKNRAKSLGKIYLRLDCGKREKLCRFYESEGFEFHSEKTRNPYPVVRYEYKL
jgi:GNAT superfamily N-acetyltransferase